MPGRSCVKRCVFRYGKFCQSLTENAYIQLLEAMVERPPPRPISDDFEIDGILSHEYNPIDGNTPLSPPPPSVGSPPPHISTFGNSGLTSPITEQPNKPPPRPYIPRRTSNSIMGVISPTLSGNASPIVVGNGNGSGNGNGGSPHALAHVPTFVRRTGSTGSTGTESPVA